MDISAVLRDRMTNRAHKDFDDQGYSEASFKDFQAAMLKKPATMLMLGDKRGVHCPAHQFAAGFTATVFDAYAKLYRARFEALTKPIDAKKVRIGYLEYRKMFTDPRIQF